MIYRRASGAASVSRYMIWCGWAGYWLAAVAIGLAGCSGPSEDSALLATVGQVRIEAAHLEALVARLPAARQPEGREIAAYRTYLQNLIDRELLLAEARVEGLDTDGWVVERLTAQEERRLVETMMQREVLAHCQVTSEEIELVYSEAGWHEQVLSQEIFVSSEATARKVITLLDQGVSFDEVADMYAVDRLLGVPVGNGQWFTYSPGDGPREVVHAVFALPEGGITEPVPFQQGYVVARAAERRKVRIEEVHDRIERVLREAKGKLLLEDYLRRLRIELKLTSQATGMELTLQALQHPEGLESLSVEQRRTPVYTFADQVVDVVEVVENVAEAVGKWPAIAEQWVNGRMKDEVLPERVIAADGRRQGLEQTTEWRWWRQRELENLMLMRLRAKMLDERLKVTEEDLREYYERHKRQFRLPAAVRVQELLVADSELARELAELASSTGDLESLIEQHSMRQNPADGILWVSAAQAPMYGEAWMNALLQAPVGVIKGPIRAREGYSIFCILERQPESYHSLDTERVRRTVELEVRRAKARDLFDRYMEELRKKRAADMVLYEGNLRHWIASR